MRRRSDEEKQWRGEEVDRWRSLEEVGGEE